MKKGRKRIINKISKNKKSQIKKIIKIKFKKVTKTKRCSYYQKLIKIFTVFIFSLLAFYLIFKFRSNKSIDNANNTSTKVGLCIICKTENLYIQEFIDHYRNLGYNHIFIYDNNDVDGERLEDVIQKEIDKGFVSIINYRGDKQRPIFRVYIDCYEKNNKDYDWLSFFDIDEFLELKPKGIKIQEFLNNERYKNCQNVKFNWVLYSDDDKLHYENKPVQERFTTPLFNNELNNHVKTTVRGNLSTNYWKGTWNPHSGVNHYICCGSSGKKISSISPWNKPYDYSFGYIKHYRTKTIEEYLNKMKKGKPDANMNYDYMVKMFFLTNKKTKEKMDIFKKEFNISYT